VTLFTLSSTLKMLHGRHHKLVDLYRISMPQLLTYDSY